MEELFEAGGVPAVMKRAARRCCTGDADRHRRRRWRENIARAPESRCGET